MQRKICYLILSLNFLLFSLSACEDTPAPNPTPTDKMEWWNEARFGMFIHWGLYSVWGGIYKGVNTDGTYVEYDNFYEGGIGTEWMQRVVKIPTETYLSRLPEFNSSRFDPDQIAQLAKDAGMKYVIITAKHHEGVCLWDSKNDPLNITLTSADHDVLKKLKEACYARGLKFGLYFSQSFDWSTKGGYGQDYYTTYTPAENEEYIDKYVLPVIDELFKKFDPDILWYDSPGAIKDQRLANKIYNHVEQVKSKKVIINDRLSEWHEGDFGTGEDDFYQGTGHGENCNMLTRSWGYGATFDQKGEAVRPHVLLFSYIVGSAARGQNALINIAPRGDGSLMEKEIERLNLVASWMSKNGNAISGTTRALEKSNPQWGRLTMNKKTNKIYLITGTRDVSLYLDGIKTNNLKDITTTSGQTVQYEIVGDDRVYIPNFRSAPIENIPSVLVAHYNGAPTILDYTYLENKQLRCSAFWGDGISFRLLTEEDNRMCLVAWRTGRISTRIKLDSESGAYNIRIDLSNKEWKSVPEFKITLTDSEGNSQSAIAVLQDVSAVFESSFNLTKGKIYDILVEKHCYDGCWLNFSHLEFEKK